MPNHRPGAAWISICNWLVLVLRSKGNVGSVWMELVGAKFSVGVKPSESVGLGGTKNGGGTPGPLSVTSRKLTVELVKSPWIICAGAEATTTQPTIMMEGIKRQADDSFVFMGVIKYHHADASTTRRKFFPIGNQRFTNSPPMTTFFVSNPRLAMRNKRWSRVRGMTESVLGKLPLGWRNYGARTVWRSMTRRERCSLAIRTLT